MRRGFELQVGVTGTTQRGVAKNYFISYPKSGRTWVRYCLGLCGVTLKFNHAGSGTGKDDIGRRFSGVIVLPDAENIIFMHRNPIDTAVSLYFQVHKKDLRWGSLRHLRRLPMLFLKGRYAPKSIDSFVLHPGYGVEKICQFNRAWLDHLKGCGNSLILTYEAARADDVSAFTGILNFLKEPTDGVETAVAKSRFDRMKEIEKKGETGTKLGLVKDDPESAKVRRGKIGGYVDYLRPETIKQCSDICEKYGLLGAE